MKHRWTLLAGFCLFAARLAFANPTTAPASSQPADPIDSLIAQLSADEWRTREDAQDELVALGDAAIGRLRVAVAENPSVEARQRAQAAINRINERQVTGASLITLHMKNATLSDVFAEISRQSGSDLQPLPPELWELRPWPKVSFDFDNQPFWNVMRVVAEQTGIELKAWNNDGLHLIQGAPAAAGGRWTVTGPFLITLHRSSRSQVIDYGAGDSVNSDFALTFSAIAEPKLRVLRASYIARLDEATDDHGNSLLNKDDDDELRRRSGLDLAYIGNNAGQWQFTARLSYPKNMGTRLTVLRGSAMVQLQTRSETIEVPNILSANNAARSLGAMSLTVRDVKKTADRYEVSVMVARDPNRPEAGPDAIDWQRVQQSLADLKIVDEQGRALERISFSSGGTDQSTEVMMSFSATEAGGTRNRTGEPSKLVWRVATEVKDVLVPFEFKDVPLPQ
ncbi:hypothetical protein BH09PLA1_BH09PLA1_30300 [soil metagenome]